MNGDSSSSSPVQMASHFSHPSSPVYFASHFGHPEDLSARSPEVANLSPGELQKGPDGFAAEPVRIYEALTPSVIVSNTAVLMCQQAPIEASNFQPTLLKAYSSRPPEAYTEVQEDPRITYERGATPPDKIEAIGAPTTAVGMCCTICGDRATGKHYGAHSCDGCKGFFRRSVRNNNTYNCRFNRNCVVNKHKRNQCRFCRFRKCIRAGMKPEAVQNERDRISQRRPCYEDSSNIVSIPFLIKAENFFKKPNAQNLAKLAQGDMTMMEIAGVKEVCDSMREQLIALVDWAQYMPAFQKLPKTDKICLLRAMAGEHLLLGAAWRSRAFEDVLLLGNNCIIPRNTSGMSQLSGSLDPDLNRIGMRVMDELIKTFREIELDEHEYVCLKAIVFFDPSVRGLHDVEEVKCIRYSVQLQLEDYIQDRALKSRGRFGRMLLALQVLQSITWEMVERIQVVELVGRAKIDSLLAEMLLGDFTDKDRSDSNSPIEVGDELRSVEGLIPLENAPSSGSGDSFLCASALTTLNIRKEEPMSPIIDQQTSPGVAMETSQSEHHLSYKAEQFYKEETTHEFF